MKKVRVPFAQKIMMFLYSIIATMTISVLGDQIWASLREGHVEAFWGSIMIISLVATAYWNEVEKEAMEKRERRRRRRERERLQWQENAGE